VRSFFETEEHGALVVSAPSRRGTVTVVPARTGARIAVYDSMASAPRVEEIDASDLADAIEKVASRTYNLARERGGGVPYTIIREVSENLIHAGFSEVVVTILDDGNTVRFADQGPGIADKERAFLPGFSTAKECLGFAGGAVDIDDNLGKGTVVTLRVAPRPKAPEAEQAPAETPPRLSNRQKQVLSLVMELGSAGPSAVARELSVGLSTAYRDLASLEEAGLILADESGKRALTDRGVALLDTILR
jgi:DNA-binding transcriptional ArsR family regulator